MLACATHKLRGNCARQSDSVPRVGRMIHATICCSRQERISMLPSAWQRRHKTTLLPLLTSRVTTVCFQLRAWFTSLPTSSILYLNPPSYYLSLSLCCFFGCRIMREIEREREGILCAELRRPSGVPRTDTQQQYFRHRSIRRVAIILLRARVSDMFFFGCASACGFDTVCYMRICSLLLDIYLLLYTCFACVLHICMIFVYIPNDIYTIGARVFYWIT